MFKSILEKVLNREDLTRTESIKIMSSVMNGELTPSQISAFLTSLRMKGECIEEITGFTEAIKGCSKPFSVNNSYAIDTCGTGGDGGRTFNISTAVAIITSASGAMVVKHGNRAVSSKSGSADVLKYLGFNIEMDEEKSLECLDKNGMTFLFAPKYHISMKNVALIRKELGVRTVFNLLGPLINPADIKGQVLGVYDGKLTDTIGEVLLRLGRERALVVHGIDGLDEITTTTETKITEVKQGSVRTYLIKPEDFGIKRVGLKDIEGGDSEENGSIIIDILKGKKGPKRDIVVMNTGAALYVSKITENLKEGIRYAEELIDSGKAYRKFQDLVTYHKGAVAI